MHLYRSTYNFEPRTSSRLKTAPFARGTSAATGAGLISESHFEIRFTNICMLGKEVVGKMSGLLT